MKSWYQQDVQALVDLLAEETEQYTRHFISGNIAEAADRKAVIDALIIEIRRRKSSSEVEDPSEQLQILRGDHLSESST
jgi:hypothetical protein